MAGTRGKVALVLGAAGKENMGQSIARRLAKAGATPFRFLERHPSA